MESEVAKLLQQIELEYCAAQNGLTGISCGSSRHQFITARMEAMSTLHSRLHTIVGENAIAMIAETLENVQKQQKK
ncbi:hypothetical protein EI42_04966 [Thermosporothrix hazakensis]|uniref:Uncharacterized protein n=2 Tax=Thermosporothrix TaxID=768650 RepID=A0A326UD33_THEHA|nr:hypothetical protein [Thermosporothrix hazakensis]PZW23583.1 hypothetical protein EI42_04966 [Thermosporothrix hazakensis]BBH86749.1 hypothetical protein KTC_15000 [Thermosporothrix sp. COM3]GCE51051.1 hypothetical protein KTH_59200 [Thermosporothrix hazakensis]